MAEPRPTPQDVFINAPVTAEYEEILTREALAFVVELHRRFDARRRELLDRRAQRQRAIDAGAMPDFLPETASVRQAEWTVAPIPADLNQPPPKTHRRTLAIVAGRP